jgi:hypothetical protein
MFLLGVIIAAAPVLAAADVIPISDVNEDDEQGRPVLRGQTVTVRGVVTVETGALADTTNIYIQDETGGVNVLQVGMASPVVALGDSVLVTGRVAHATSSGRTAMYVSGQHPGTRLQIISGGNPLPDPVVLTAREVFLDGEDYEGTWAVVRMVELAPGNAWPSCSGDQDGRTKIADADTTCWMWFARGSDLCGSDEPPGYFDVYGVVTPDLRPQWRPGHGVLPPTRSHVLSVGPGSGFASVEPDWVYAGYEVDLTFSISADGGLLTQVRVQIPDGWTFSGDSADVSLQGPGFVSASVDATPGDVTLTGCELMRGETSTMTLLDMVAPPSAGTGAFTTLTADEGGDPAPLSSSPEVGVGVLAEAGTILINEIYAHSGGSDLSDRSEFIELVNPGDDPVDLTGWVLTDIDNSGACDGSNLWAFPEGTTLDGGDYLVVAKDARGAVFGQGFYYNFYDYFETEDERWPDFEMVDPYGPTNQDLDWPQSDNMVLLTGNDLDLSVSQEIRLIGGADGTGTLVSNMPGYDAVLLYSDRTLVSVVDAVEYRDPVLLAQDPCVGAPGLGGAYDAWVPGPPPVGTSLCRDDLSTDTGSSIEDLFLAAPTPRHQNPSSDDSPPAIITASGVGLDIVLVVFAEPVMREEAETRSNYDLGDAVTVLAANLSRDGRTVLLHTSPRTPGDATALRVSGVSDVFGNPMEPYEGEVQTSTDAVSISDVQAYDEDGLSIMSGQTVRVAGFTTVPPGVFQPDRTNMYIQDLDGWGVNVYAADPMQLPPLEGDLVRVTGDVLDYISSSSGAGATTEIDATSITVLARGFDPLDPVELRSGEVNREENEGRLVKSSGVVVSVEGFAVYMDDGSGPTQVYQNFTDLDFGVFAVGDSVEITGVVLQYDLTRPFLSGYELAPRYDSDMVILNANYPEEAVADVTARVIDRRAEEEIAISFNAPRASHVTVRVYDMKGREVATLYDGLCLGSQLATWDGRDDRGRKVPAGVYLCHVMARDRAEGDGSNAAVPIVVGAKLD